MSESPLTPKIELLIDGSPADAAIVESIMSVRVHQHLEFADAIEVKLSNDDLAWTDGEALTEGKKLAVKMGYMETEAVQVCAGEIVRRDCEFPTYGPSVVTVVALDREHRLKRGRLSRTFVDMKDSEIVAQIAGDAGLTADVEDSKVKHRYVFQCAQTNLSFIRERAMLLNYEVDVDRENKTISFKSKCKPSESFSEDAKGDLHWGENLLRFSPRISTEQQVSKVVVKGWSMEKKETIEGTASSTDIGYKMGGSGFALGSKVATDHYGAREVLYEHRPMHEQAEADGMAKAFLNKLSMSYTEGEAVVMGDPSIEAGKSLSVSGVGIRAGGEFYVYKVLHHFESGVGFATHLNYLRSTQRSKVEPLEPLPEPVAAREEPEREEQHWVEFRVGSETGESLEGTSYKVTLPGGRIEQGTLGADQTIKIEGVRDPGEAQIEINQPDEMNPLE